MSEDLVAAAATQVGYSSSMNTYGVGDVEPFGAVGVNKLAIDEQLGGGLEDHRAIWLNPFLVTSSLGSLDTHPSITTTYAAIVQSTSAFLDYLPLTPLTWN